MNLKAENIATLNSAADWWARFIHKWLYHWHTDGDLKTWGEKNKIVIAYRCRRCAEVYSVKKYRRKGF